MTREIIDVRRDNPIASAYMPYIVAGVRKFCVDHDTESDPDEQGELVWRMFGAGDPQLGMWIVVEHGRILGHLYATPEPLGPPARYQYVLIRQASVIPGADTRAETEAIFARCVLWAEKLGVTRIMALTPKSSRAVHRRWGFHHYKSLLVYDIKEARHGVSGSGWGTAASAVPAGDVAGGGVR